MLLLQLPGPYPGKVNQMFSTDQSSVKQRKKKWGVGGGVNKLSRQAVHTVRFPMCAVIVHVTCEGIHECRLPFFHRVRLACLQLLGSIFQQVPQLGCNTETLTLHEAVCDGVN